MFLANLFLSVFTVMACSGIASANDDYRSQVRFEISRAEGAILNTLPAFQPPFSGSSFCLSFETRFAQVNLDSLYRILRDKDAEQILPQLERPRQVAVKAALGLESYSLILKNIEAAQAIQKTMACRSSKDQASLRSDLIAIYRDLIVAHSSIDQNNTAIYSAIDSAFRSGLLTTQEVTYLKQ